MSQNLKNFKCVSSLSVLRKMYENQQDIYDIISEFVKTIIVSRSLKTFELLEMCNYLKEEYGVEIVTNVVKTALKKIDILKRVKNVYTLEKCLAQEEVKSINEQISQSKSSISKILDDYVKYKCIKEKSETFDDISAKEDFCKFIVDKNLIDSSQTGVISAFIIENQGNVDFEKACQCIREGLIIYNGLSYTADGELVEQLDTPLTIYLETELLFHAIGFNGTLYKSLFGDFYQIVSDINDATTKLYGKKIITLSFFQETKKEIEKYFRQAESISKNSGKIDPSKPAMRIIVNGCRGVADVKQKEIEFWADIKRMGINEDDMIFDVSNAYYAQYNLSVEEDIPDSNANEEANKAYDIGQMLSKVNYLRRNTNPGTFRSIKAIMLTGNRKTLSISDKHKKHQEVPLATTLSFLTNRFWYSLHKGIFKGNSTVPGANVITMAQIAFSQRVNEGLASEFQRVNRQLEEGEITKENLNDIIAGFKFGHLQPENVTKAIVDNDFCFDLFNGEAIEQAKSERFLERQRHKDEIRRKSEEIANQNKTIELLIKDRNDDEQKKHQEALKLYLKLQDEYVNREMKKNNFKQYSIVCVYIIIAIAMIILTVLKNIDIIAGAIVMSLIVIEPIIERFVRPLINYSVIEAFNWVSKNSVKEEFKKNILVEYEKCYPKPKLVLSKKEDYIVNDNDVSSEN